MDLILGRFKYFISALKWERPFLVAALYLMTFVPGISKDFIVKGKITSSSGTAIPNATVSMTAGNIEYEAVSGYDGFYSLRISGIFSNVTGHLEAGMPFPNPFTSSVKIPFIINTRGDIHFAVYSLTGQKITDNIYPRVDAGSYRLVWDGTNSNGAPVRSGFYIYALTFQGKTYSGRLIKSTGFSSISSGNYLEPVILPFIPTVPSGSVRIPVITNVGSNDYYPVRLTDISIASDTTIDFELTLKQVLPFKTQDKYIAMATESGYRPLILKGINLGSSPPGYFPGEIAYAIPDETYKMWIKRMAEAGFTAIRVYTLHPPVFYERLAEYNERHKDKPLLLFQEIWLDDISDPSNPASYDLTQRETTFRSDIHEVINCIHGKNNIGFRPGKAYGNYATDLSRWTAGYILGREIAPREVITTNSYHPDLKSFTGTQFSIANATATDVFVTQMLDEAAGFESSNFNVHRPLSVASWPTLDPLIHPAETNPTEDIASFDLERIEGRNAQAGLFASYHAYPYYPNFVSLEPSYRAYSDNIGPDSYLGYLIDLKNHYSDIPLVIAEFGVPSSWGSAHQSFSNMNHGGYSEEQQGEKDIRLMHNILDAGCAGGFMFSWMDEWFKPTWIVQYLEAFGFLSDGAIIPTRQLWQNLTSPEQNFGFIGFDQENPLPFIPYETDNISGSINKIEARSDNAFFYLNIHPSGTIVPGDTMMIAFDTYSSATGESQLPNGKHLINRSEFLLTAVFGSDTSDFQVTEAYNMYGLTPRFNLSDPLVQKYRSVVSDGAPWKEMIWVNDGDTHTSQKIGRLPAERSDDFTPGQRTAIAWNDNNVKIRIPWTLLYVYDPTQMYVIDGADSQDGGLTFNIHTTKTDGIATSVYFRNSVTSTNDRYNWTPWLIVPPTSPREKKSLQVVEAGLSSIPRFAD